MSKSIPESFHSVTPVLIVEGAAKAIDLYKKAFGAEEVYRMDCPSGSGKIMHACLRIGNSNVFMSDAAPEKGCGPASVSSFYIYLDDVDGAFKKAAKAGLSELMPVSDMFWGDRMGALEDAFGIRWTLATHMREVSPEEMQEGAKEWAKAAA